MAKPRAVPEKKPKPKPKTGMDAIGGELPPAPTAAEWEAIKKKRATAAPRPKSPPPPKKVSPEPKGLRSRRQTERAILKRGLDAF